MKSFRAYLADRIGERGGEGGIFVLLFSGALFCFRALWAVPLALLIRLIRPLRTVRTGPIRSDRIGHFAADAGQQHAGFQVEPTTNLELHYLQEPVSNRFWAELVCRNFTCLPWTRYLDFWNRVLPGGAVHHRPSSTTISRDIHGYQERATTRFSFLPAENERARRWLESRGWREGQPFVCLLVRDSRYLEQDPVQAARLKKVLDADKGFVRYHDYRDSFIETYAKGARWLADRGVLVLRMGKLMAHPLLANHPGVIDYAFDPERSDFLDVWLFAHCALCISTLSGPDTISDYYRRPLLFVNSNPLQRAFTWSDALHFPKILYWKESGVLLSCREHLDHSFMRREEYTAAGIAIWDLSADQLAAAFRERWERLQGTWEDSPADRERHQCFWEIFTAHPGFPRYHGWIHPRAAVGTTWLREAGDRFLL